MQNSSRGAEGQGSRGTLPCSPAPLHVFFAFTSTFTCFTLCELYISTMNIYRVNGTLFSSHRPGSLNGLMCTIDDQAKVLQDVRSSYGFNSFWADDDGAIHHLAFVFKLAETIRILLDIAIGKL